MFVNYHGAPNSEGKAPIMPACSRRQAQKDRIKVEGDKSADLRCVQFVVYKFVNLNAIVYAGFINVFFFSFASMASDPHNISYP